MLAHTDCYFDQIWDYKLGKLKKDLQYQADDKFLMHEAAVLCLAFSSDSELLVSGDQEGCIKIWQVKTGKCIRKFPEAHPEGVTSVRFHGTMILSTSFDNTLRTHGIKSGKTLKIFRGHLSFVNAALMLSGGTFVATCSSDGTIKIFDAKTTECVNTVRPTMQDATGAAEKLGEAVTAINSIALLPRKQDAIVVCSRSPQLYIMNSSGEVSATYSCENPKTTLLGCTISPRGEWIYAFGKPRVAFILLF